MRTCRYQNIMSEDIYLQYYLQYHLHPKERSSDQRTQFSDLMVFVFRWESIRETYFETRLNYQMRGGAALPTPPTPRAAGFVFGYQTNIKPPRSSSPACSPDETCSRTYFVLRRYPEDVGCGMWVYLICSVGEVLGTGSGGGSTPSRCFRTRILTDYDYWDWVPGRSDYALRLTKLQ